MKQDPIRRFEQPAPRATAKLAIFIAAAVALASAPALSQGAVAPGGAPMAPQPRMVSGTSDSMASSKWSSADPVSGVVATLTDPSGGRTRRAISNAEGVLSLGPVPEGTYDLAIELPRASTNRPERQQVLVGMLAPKTQTLIGTTTWVRAQNGKLKVVIGPKGEPEAITSFEGVTHKDAWDVNKFGAGGGRDVRLVILLPSAAQAQR